MTVAALMVVMLAMSLTPAVARPLHQYFCRQPGWANFIILPYENPDYVNMGFDCVKLPRDQWF